MNNTLNITEPAGKMTIHMESFFPATFSDTTKLAKVVWSDWDHCEGLISQMQEYLRSAARMQEASAKVYLDDLEESKRKRTGLAMSKEHLRHVKAREKDLEREANTCKREAQRLLKNLKTVEDFAQKKLARW